MAHGREAEVDYVLDERGVFGGIGRGFRGLH